MRQALVKRPSPVRLKALYLRNFRNYEEAEFHFGPKLNVIYGKNAQGKTNLLEAIYLVATGRSFRTQHLSELIRSGQTFFHLEARIEKDHVHQTIRLTFDGTQKQLQIDANRYSSFHPLLGILPCVLLAPQDVEWIDGPPAIRRRFLNMHLAQSDPLYVHHLTRFWRALKQRNSLLKKRLKDSIEYWEIEMAQSADYLSQMRTQMIEEIQEPLFTQSGKLSFAKEQHRMQLQVSQGASYLKLLQKMRAREMELGFTLMGPHRDDLFFYIDQKEARLFASEGQKRTAIAAIRLAEWELLSQKTRTPALLAIDDFGVHLDEERQTILRSQLSTLSQVFITTPIHSDLEGHFINVARTPHPEEKSS